MQNYIENVNFPVLSQFPPTDDWYTFFCSCGGKIDLKGSTEVDTALNNIGFIVCPKCFQKYTPDDFIWLFRGRHPVELPSDMYKEVNNEKE